MALTKRAVRLIAAGATIIAAVACPAAAHAAAEPVTLSASAQGAGALTITPAEAGQPALPCSPQDRSGCSPTYPKGTRVTLTAVPDATVAGARLERWSDYRCPDDGPRCTLVLNADEVLDAIFAPVFLTVQEGSFGPVYVTPPGQDCTFARDAVTGVAAPCRIPFEPWSLAAIARDPALAGNPQHGWSGGCFSREAVCRVRMRRDQTVVAGDLPRPASPGPGQSMRFGYAGPKGGQIRVTGAGATRTCKKTCILGGFAPNSKIRVSARSSKKITFKRWSDIRDTKTSRLVYVGDPTALQVVFKKRR